ncbi:MAG: hypothetical protein WBI07_12025 [Mobilitalea sp.]
MLEAITLNDLIKDLNKRHGDAEEVPLALLIGSANCNFMRDNILQRINDYHHGSNYGINFYLPGYGAYWYGHLGPQETVCTINDVDWLYSSKLFNEFINELETRTRWEYSGEVELLLLSYKNGTLDFSEVVIFRLDKMVAEGVISSPANLFYKIFRRFKVVNSVHKASDQFTLKYIGEEIVKDITNTIPLVNQLMKGRHYCTRDISR